MDFIRLWTHLKWTPPVSSLWTLLMDPPPTVDFLCTRPVGPPTVPSLWTHPVDPPLYPSFELPHWTPHCTVPLDSLSGPEGVLTSRDFHYLEILVLRWVFLMKIFVIVFLAGKGKFVSNCLLIEIGWKLALGGSFLDSHDPRIKGLRGFSFN